MSTKAGVGMSYHHNPNVAGREAAEQALGKAGVAKADFVFMFTSIGYDQNTPYCVQLARVPEVYPSQVARRRAR